MKGFINELSVVTGLPFNEIKNDFRVIWVGGNCVQVINYLKILIYTDTLLKLKIPKNQLNIEGYNFEIKELNKREILIKGIINKIELEKEITPLQTYKKKGDKLEN